MFYTWSHKKNFRKLIFEKDIEKVFAAEVQSLISSVAKKVEVNIDYDPNLEVEKIYGYAPRPRSNGVSIGLENMNSGLTEVVMMRFRPSRRLRVTISRPTTSTTVPMMEEILVASASSAVWAASAFTLHARSFGR